MFANSLWIKVNVIVSHLIALFYFKFPGSKNLLSTIIYTLRNQYLQFHVGSLLVNN